jgi:hypothetical protein
VQGQAGRPGKTALTYESYPHNSMDFAPSTRGVKDLFRNPIWKLFRLSRISVAHLRIGDRHSRRDRRWQADDAAIVQRKTLGSGHAGLGHVGVRTGSIARLGAARTARCRRGTRGGAAQRMKDG